MNFVRALLVFSSLWGYSTGRHLILSMSILGLIVTFAPLIIYKIWKKEVPEIYEIIIILFIFGLLFLGNVRGIYSDFWWWEILLNLLGALILGFAGLTIVYVLNKEEIIDANPFIMVFLAFCFAFAIGGLWEIFEFSLDKIFGFNLQRGELEDTMTDMIVNAVGAFFVCFIGYLRIKDGKMIIFSSFLEGFMNRHKKLFKSKEHLERSSERIKEIINKGEGEMVEFKSSLRRNLHTGEFDRNIEHGILKTISAYLNSNGGILLVGVSDEGKVIGLEKDGFENNDKLKLYFTNLLKHHVGSQFLPFIDFELFPVEDKHILKVECRESEKRVFLKFGGEEEFYVRNGPSSAKLNGSELIDYVKNKFG